MRPTRLYASTAYSLAFAFNDGVGYFAGTATIEGYATDATDGTLLWETLDKCGGTTALAKFGEPSVRRTLPHVANSTFSFVAFDCFVLITTTATPRYPPNEGT